MKNYLKIILVGGASWTKDNKIFGGQLSDISNLINENVMVIACDPEHKYESDRYLEKIVKVPICRINSPNALNLKALNIYERYASELFDEMTMSDDTYYLVLVFTGIERDEPSFNVAKKLQIKKSFFLNNNNALFLGMGCLCKPINLQEFVSKINVFPELNSNLNKLFSLQNAYYAYQNNIDGLYRAYMNNNMPIWANSSMKKLKHIGINGLMDVYNYYLSISDYKNIGIRRLIGEELEKNDLINFWDERPNDFVS